MTRLLTGQVPEVPQLTMPQTAQLVATAGVAAVAVIAVGLAALYGRRHRTARYLLVLAGGTIASVNEPVADALGGCLHPQQGGWTVFSTLDRPIPVWVVIAYGLFFGAVPLVVYALMRTGADPRRRFIQAISVIFAANLLIELPILGGDMYVYYGEQAFKIFGMFPLHWLFVNGVGVATIALVLYRFGDRFSGAAALWLLAIPGTAQVAAFTVGLPAFSMYNTDADSVYKWVGSAGTMLLGVATLRALSRLVPADGPAQHARRAEPAAAGVAG